MKIRTILTFTGIVSALLGALVAYLVLSVPNDLRADGLLKQARTDMTAGNHEKARATLKQVVQQYPRTDAAAAATVALLSLAEKERDDLSRGLAQLRALHEQQARLIADLQKNVTDIKAAPPPAVTVQAPAPKPAAKKAAPKKTSKKKTTRRRR